MDKESFVSSLQSRCLATEADMFTELERPVGQQPYVGDVRRSKWFHSLSNADRNQLRDVIRFALHSIVFSMLCDLDGVGSVAGTREGGMYVLHYSEGSTEVDLTDPNQEYLHDIFRSLMDPLYES